MSFDSPKNGDNKTDDERVRDSMRDLGVAREKPKSAKFLRATSVLTEKDRKEVGKATAMFGLPTVREGRGFTNYVRMLTTIALALGQKLADLEATVAELKGACKAKDEEIAFLRRRTAEGGVP